MIKHIDISNQNLKRLKDIQLGNSNHQEIVRPPKDNYISVKDLDAMINTERKLQEAKFMNLYRQNKRLYFHSPDQKNTQDLRYFQQTKFDTRNLESPEYYIDDLMQSSQNFQQEKSETNINQQQQEIDGESIKVNKYPIGNRDLLDKIEILNKHKEKIYKLRHFSNYQYEREEERDKDNQNNKRNIGNQSKYQKKIRVYSPRRKNQYDKYNDTYNCEQDYECQYEYNKVEKTRYPVQINQQKSPKGKEQLPQIYTQYQQVYGKKKQNPYDIQANLNYLPSQSSQNSLTKLEESQQEYWKCMNKIQVGNMNENYKTISNFKKSRSLSPKLQRNNIISPTKKQQNSIQKLDDNDFGVKRISFSNQQQQQQ